MAEGFVLLALESTSDLISGQDIGIIPYNSLVDSPYFNTNGRTYLYSYLGTIRHKILPENHVRTQLAHLGDKPDVLITTKLDVRNKEETQTQLWVCCKR